MISFGFLLPSLGEIQSKCLGVEHREEFISPFLFLISLLLGEWKCLGVEPAGGFV